MHEASIAQAIMGEIERQLDEGKILGRVQTVYLRIGQLTAVVTDNLRFMFEVIAKDTVFEGVELQIEDVPVRGVCRDCEAAFEIEELRFSCLQCGSGEVDIVSGRELMIEAVEIN